MYMEFSDNCSRCIVTVSMVELFSQLKRSCKLVSSFAAIIFHWSYCRCINMIFTCLRVWSDGRMVGCLFTFLCGRTPPCNDQPLVGYIPEWSDAFLSGRTHS